MAMRIFAPAKVNLHLAVGDARSDGYHSVVTVLQALAFGDTVRIERDSEFGFACTPDLGLRPEDNLACRAARAMAERFERPLDVAIRVEKVIPAGAGLGGASSDAAATICGLAAVWGIDPRAPEITEVARSLGADVPFFLTGGAALYGGRGDQFERTVPTLHAPMVLVKPAEPVNTGEAYAAFDRTHRQAAPAPSALIAALERGSAAEVARHLYNNMTEASTGLVPGIAGALRLVAESPGILGAAMAGSGSAVFGICASEADALRCAADARAAGFWSEAANTHSGGCAG
ncbi:4-(cytidine 5'-diphospho)-2-C-methyl-D-erythritol kinase [bacterium]|nr:4-(cytidine 5'-diphospho)-2-C-methyl-D-erythritol kinase [bacterium]